MIKKIFQKILLKTGKTYLIDESIPDRLLVNVLVNRFFMLTRGIIFLRKKVFLGSSCKILNKKNFEFGRSVTIDKKHRFGWICKKQNNTRRWCENRSIFFFNYH